ncbi:hypothetical protein CA2015_0797 [Cyclobacterium amurskyense]|uniref:Uncharacterized protein n=1 Tax=Cyclobacterium amurskyense TaxID=320787 RepID=A0A0H4P724_9BACT|nr:hypothetical protein CA2015_0797 [Cyclobacterium amurskyense]
MAKKPSPFFTYIAFRYGGTNWYTTRNLEGTFPNSFFEENLQKVTLWLQCFSQPYADLDQALSTYINRKATISK